MQQHFQDFSENGFWPGLANENRRKVFLSYLLLVVSLVLVAALSLL